MTKYYKTFKEAQKAYSNQIGYALNEEHKHCSSITMYHLKSGRNKGKYFIGTRLEWLNL